jgi:GT2 family glycosyltransferase
MVQEPRVSIILLNWNTWSDTIECLESLDQISYLEYDIVIVDNGSTDDSVIKICDYLSNSGWILKDSPIIESFPTRSYVQAIAGGFERAGSQKAIRRCDFILNSVNRGFTGGNNIAMKFAGGKLAPDYILLLNNDTVVAEDFLKELVKAMEEHLDCGFASPMILDCVADGVAKRTSTIQYAGAVQSLYLFIPLHRRQSELDDGKEVLPSLTGYAHGTCMLVRAQAIKEIGMLDEDYFCYREENDWGLRGKKKGWKALFVPTSKVWHKGGKSSGQVRGMALYYMARNSILIIKKNASLLEKTVFSVSFVSFSFPYRVVKLMLLKRDIESTRIFIKGIRDGLKWKGTAP